jgi:excinuclease UvrABC nuclease subunit
MTEVDIKSLPYVRFSECGFLPRIAGVYFVVDPDGSVAYVGEASNIKRRWHGHHVRRELPYDIEQARLWRISWIPIDTGVRERRQTERELIDKLMPRFNLRETQIKAGVWRLAALKMEKPKRGPEKGFKAKKAKKGSAK